MTEKSLRNDREIPKKWQRNHEEMAEKWLRMNGKISFMPINDWNDPFSFAVHEQSVMRLSSTILPC
jgi:hypothetical protein